MDAFSTGDPWSTELSRTGFMAVLTAEMENHPEEYFAMRADWADKNSATKAILKGIMEAAMVG